MKVPGQVHTGKSPLGLGTSWQLQTRHDTAVFISAVAHNPTAIQGGAECHHRRFVARCSMHCSQAYTGVLPPSKMLSKTRRDLATGLCSRKGPVITKEHGMAGSCCLILRHQHQVLLHSYCIPSLKMQVHHTFQIE